VKKFIVPLTLSLAGMLPIDSTLAVEANDPPPLCAPTTAGSQGECGGDKYQSIVKAFNECGFEKVCSPRGTFAIYPSLECEYRYGEVVCEAWPKTWPGTDAPITYLWSAYGSLSLPAGYGNHSPDVVFNCLHSRGGTVILRMQAPGGTNWVQMSVGLPCRNLLPQ
jgi:hypothetical protein